MSGWPGGAGGGWFVFLHYEIILYEIALAFSFFAMARERSSGGKIA